MRIRAEPERSDGRTKVAAGRVVGMGQTSTPSTSDSPADLDGVSANEPWTRRWRQSELFEWWPVALVAVLAIGCLIVVWLIARNFL